MGQNNNLGKRYMRVYYTILATLLISLKLYQNKKLPKKILENKTHFISKGREEEEKNRTAKREKKSARRLFWPRS